MENRFEKYVLYVRENGKLVDINPTSFDSSNEAFLLFKELYDTNYGSIHEDGNLIAIHTGGWSENEMLINEFEQTGWWVRNHCITARGGHFYFNTEIYGDKEWKIEKSKKSD